MAGAFGRCQRRLGRGSELVARTRDVRVDLPARGHSSTSIPCPFHRPQHQGTDDLPGSLHTCTLYQIAELRSFSLRAHTPTHLHPSRYKCVLLLDTSYCIYHCYCPAESWMRMRHEFFPRFFFTLSHFK